MNTEPSQADISKHGDAGNGDAWRDLGRWRFDAQTIFLVSMVAVGIMVAIYLGFFYDDTPREELLAPVGPRVVDGDRAYGYLKQVCAIGPRTSGSPGMQAQQALLKKHFESLGGQVRLQEFRARDPRDGSAVPMANMIVHWHPSAKTRILLCAHYDTRPFPDRDPRNPRGVFVGANDGGSGVAVLMELAHHLGKLDGPVGVDFCLFDGEEYVFNERDPYFIGSEYFAADYVAAPPAYKYRGAVLLDMVGDAKLQIFQEPNSMSWKDSRPLVLEIWKTARGLGVKEFVHRRGSVWIRDDHLALHDIAKIPAIDIIDFDYPYWHTQEDTVDKCSGESLGKVGWVIHEWLQREVRR